MRAVLPLPNLSSTTKVLIVGYGHFGQHARQLLEATAPLLSVTIHQPPPRQIRDGSFDISEYDFIILAVPIREYEQVIKDVVPRMKENAIIVDVATVKCHTTALLEKYAKGRYWIAMHPLWGPASFRMTKGNIQGYRLVVTGHTLPNRVYRQLRAMVKHLGIIVVEMTASEHDGLIAQTLFIRHLIGQVLYFAGIQRTKIDTVSFNALMDSVAGVEEDIGLFLDVVEFNPAPCLSALGRIEDAMHQVRLMLVGTRKQ